MTREEQIDFIENAETRAQGYLCQWLSVPEFREALHRDRSREMERILAEETLQELAAGRGKIADGAKTLLAQIDEMRRAGGDPVCILEEDGRAWVFDATEQMGT